MAAKIIVVDDSRAIRMILKKMLLEMGFEVVEAGDGVEALTRLGENKSVDLAMVDWNMPNMNGYEFIQNVRSKPEFNGMKIMMVTTEAEIDRMTMALSAGAQEYVMKPFTKEMIIQKLEMLGINA